MSRKNKRRTQSVEEEDEISSEFLDEEEEEEEQEEEDEEERVRRSPRTRDEYEIALAIYEKEKKDYERALKHYEAAQKIVAEYEGFFLTLTGISLIEPPKKGNEETATWLLEFRDNKTKEKAVIKVKDDIRNWHFKEGKYMFPKPIYIPPKPVPPKPPERPLTAF